MIGLEIRNLAFEARVEYLLKNCGELLIESMDEPDFLILKGTNYFFSPVKWRFLTINIIETQPGRKTRRHFYYFTEALLDDPAINDEIKTSLLFNLEIFR